MIGPSVEHHADLPAHERRLLHRRFYNIVHSACFVRPALSSDEQLDWEAFSIAASRRLADPTTWAKSEWSIFQFQMLDFDAVLEGWYG